MKKIILLMSVIMISFSIAKQTKDNFSLMKPITNVPDITYVRNVCSDGLLFKFFFKSSFGLIDVIQVQEYDKNLNLVKPKECNWVGVQK